MLRVTNSKLQKQSQGFFDELRDVDWGKDKQTSEDPLDPRIEPHGPQGVIDEGNYEDFEPSQIDAPIEDDLEFEDEFRGEEELPNEIEYEGSQQLVYDGIDNDEVISFDYTNRHGMYAGTRTVEPHYTFVAYSTGNEVLVTHDLNKGEIRAFIVGNIHPFGVRYKDQKFIPRNEIMRGIN